jgi:hypothetical protein
VAVYRYGFVLMMLVTLLTFAMIAPRSRWAPVVTAGLEAVTVLAALSRARARRRLFGLAMTASVATIGLAVAAAFGGRYQTGVADAFAALLLVLVPVAIASDFRRNLTVTLESVTAAICIYIVLGLLFASLAAAVSAIAGSPYFAGRPSADTSDYVYFSFITLATVGYGDYVPALRVGRALSVLEGLMGQLYLVTVVALVVGNLGLRRR